MSSYPGPGAAANPTNPLETVAPADEQTPLLTNGTRSELHQSISKQSRTDPLRSNDDLVEPGEIRHGEAKAENGIYATIAVMMLGVFVSQTDSSLVLASYSEIASEFGDLDSGTWILSAFIIAQCVAQPLYGKLGDIYGRKACLQASYVLFALGTTGIGLSKSLGHVIASRAIQGAGASGMLSMVSIIITDIVPIHEVASMRSYVNVLQTTGRSCGGVVGGYLTQALGWRWAFGIQVPPTIIAILLVQWRLHLTDQTTKSVQSKWEKLKRIDFIGSAFLCFAIFAICFVLDVGGQQMSWTSAPIMGIGIAGAVSIVGFVVSACFVAEPIFPLRLVRHYVVITNYLLAVLSLGTQFSLVMMVPLYFQATRRASVAAAGAYLIPAFVGNTLGSLLSGYWIKKTGLYKPPTVLAPASAILCMCLCYFLWQGNTSALGSLAIFPGGFAAGMVGSAAYIGLAAGVPEDDIAVAGSGMYLFFNFGAIAGASVGSAIYQQSLKTSLDAALDGYADKTEIIQNALASINYVQQASEKLRSVMVPAYVYSFHQVILMGLFSSCVGLFLAAISSSKRLKR